MKTQSKLTLSIHRAIWPGIKISFLLIISFAFSSPQSNHEDPRLIPNQGTDTVHFVVSSGIQNPSDAIRLEQSLEKLPKEIVTDAIIHAEKNECHIITRRRNFPVPMAKAAAQKEGFELTHISNPLCGH